MSTSQQTSPFSRRSRRPKKDFSLLGSAGALLLSITLTACGSSPGGLAVDTTAPTISSSTPADGSAVGADATLSITFSEAMDTSTVVIAATDGTNTYDLGTLAWSADKTVAAFSSPPTPLTNGATYAVTVDGKDLAGNAMASTNISIAVEDAPKVIVVSPAASAADVPVTNGVSLQFNVPVDRTSVETALSVTTAGPTVTCLFSWSADSKIVNCSPSSPLDYGATYTVDLAASANSAHSGPISANSLVPSTFTTATAPDTTPPTVVGRDTTNDVATNNVLTSASVTIIFSEPVNQAQAQGAFSLGLSPGGTPTGVFSWDATGTKMTFNPSTDFAHGATGTWTVASGVQDTSGNPMVSSATGTFKVVKETSEVLHAVPTQSGWLDVYATSAGAVHVDAETTFAGDSLPNTTGLTYYTFDFSSLAHTPVGVTAASLRVALDDVAGTPSPSLGYFRAQSLNYGTTLDITDDVVGTDYYCSHYSPFPMAKVSEGDALAPGPFYCAPSYRVYYRTTLSTTWSEETIQTVNVTVIVQYQWSNRASRNNLSQFRLSWDTATDSDDATDYFQLYGPSHANADFRPALAISYDYAW